MKVDYIIVGLGLAGLAFAEQLRKNNKTFVVFEDESQQSSIVAGGIYNPVILKRFSLAWNADDQLKIAIPFYEKLENEFEILVDRKLVTKKVFKSIEEQNNWFAAADKPILENFLDTHLDFNHYQGLLANFGLGNVKKTGWVDTKTLLHFYRDFLKKDNKLIQSQFEYQEVDFVNNSLKYKEIETTTLVFCEGFGVSNNPFFNYLPLNETKGEVLIIYAPKLEVDFMIKSSVFVLPLGNHHFKVGATFNWIDKTEHPTEEAKNELLENLKKVIDVDFTIINQLAGIRPTVKDRKPLVGKHPKHPQLAILNGLGTRGVLIAPVVAQQLFNHLEKNEELDKEIDIKRFE